MVVVVLALVVGGVVVGARRDGSLDTLTDLEQLDRYGEVPAFTLTERSGRRVTTADLRGAVWVVHGPSPRERSPAATHAGASREVTDMTMKRGVLLCVLPGVALGTAMHGAAQPPEGTAARGAAVFRQCVACHTVESGVHLTGPSLAHVWGRRAATVEGFTRYSEPLKRATVVWDAPTLDRWLRDPQGLVPGNLMTFPGLKDERQRADLVAYLRAVDAGQAPAAAPGGRMMAGPARPDLKTLGPERRVKGIRHCGDGYHVITEDGRTVPFWEFNLRFKTDSSRLGPVAGKPVLVPAGMQGDRASVVFSSPAEIGRLIETRC
jgi:cytochrome c